MPPLSPATPPTLDPVALARWQAMAPPETPWLHDEAGRRMVERLQWIRQKPERWTHWEPVRGGLAVHASLAQVCGSEGRVVEFEPRRQVVARRRWLPAWWRPARWTHGGLPLGEPEPGSQDMVWANMALHLAADPQGLLARWHRLLRPQGFVMFSCLGPDTAIELHQLYQQLGWPPAGAALTDMHDWGDMLVHTGFAEPVMDMERLVLTFETPERLLGELASLGRNFHPQRFAGLRGRRWRQRLVDAIAQHWPRQPDGRLPLSVELIYGHALKPEPRIKVDAVSTVAMADMRRMLKSAGPAQPPQ